MKGYKARRIRKGLENSTRSIGTIDDKNKSIQTEQLSLFLSMNTEVYTYGNDLQGPLVQILNGQRDDGQ